MAEDTPNIQLHRSELADNVNLAEDFNTNWNLIDAYVGAAKGTKDSIALRLIESINTNGTLKGAQIIARLEALEAAIWNQHFGNLLDPYGGMESFSGGGAAAPDGWTLVGSGATVAREATTKKHGNYSVKVTRGGTDCRIVFSSVIDATYAPNRTFTFGCWVWASVASRARIGIYDDVAGYSYSSYHTGNSTWQFLTVTVTINGGAESNAIACHVITGDTSVYFDGAVLVEGTVCPTYMPAVKPVLLATPITSTDWDGDSKSSSEADLDLSAFGNGVPPGVKAVFVHIAFQDSGSATGTAYLRLGIGGVALTGLNTMVGINVSTLADNNPLYSSGIVICDSNGDIRYKIVATGANTAPTFLLILGYFLGE